MRWCAVSRVVRAAERAYPFDLSGGPMHGAVDDVIRGLVMDRCVDRVSSRGAIVFVHACVEVSDHDSVGRRKEEVFLDAFVPLEFIERQVGVPETNAGEASGVVQPRSVQFERTVRYGTCGDVRPLNQNADHGAIPFGDGLKYEIDESFLVRPAW